MRIIIALGLLFALISSCTRDTSTTAENKSLVAADTLVGRKTIRNEIAGASYRKRAIAYFVITNSDTSGLMCIFSESKEGGKVTLDLQYQKPSTYNQRLKELKKVLPEVEKDFILDSLKLIFLGRLIFNGDIAIDVTKQFEQKFGLTNKSR